MSSIASFGVLIPPYEKMSLGKTTLRITLALVAFCTSFWGMMRAIAEMVKQNAVQIGQLRRDAKGRDRQIAKLFALVREKDQQIAALQAEISGLRAENVGQQKQLDQLNNRLVVVTRERDEAIAKLKAQGRP